MFEIPAHLFIQFYCKETSGRRINTRIYILITSIIHTYILIFIHMDLSCGFFIPDYYVLTVHIGDFCITVPHMHTEGIAQMLVLKKHGSLVSY